jgi:predicted GIY-YIG superfamily endonuclease
MRSLITADTLGWLYILCFSRPIGNPLNRRAQASHYLGWASDVAARIAQHAAGRGQALTVAAVEMGISWQVYYRPGTPALERWLKAHHKNTPQLCPHCATSRGRAARYGFQPLDQLAFDFDSGELPEVTIGRMDWLEIKINQEWRSKRIPAAYGLDDDLL